VITALLIAAGGASGALARYFLINFAQQRITHEVMGIPLSTLVVNVVGSLCIGALYVVLIERLQLSPEWRHFLMVGFFAAFTTFSTFALDTVHMLEAGHHSEAFIYIIASLSLCVLGCWLAIVTTRLL